MTWLKVNIPVLFSPTFWGVTLTAFFGLAEAWQWFKPEIADILVKWSASVVGVNIVWKFGKKFSGK